MGKSDGISESDQSDWNAAKATLIRIDEIKKWLIIATVKWDYDLKFKWLKAYFLELVSVMNDTDDMQQRKRFHEVRENYKVYKNAIRTGKRSIPAHIFDSFDDWEIELKNIEQKYGMNLPKKQDQRFSAAH